MDEHIRDLELAEVICASDALNNARTVLEEALEDNVEDNDEEWCEGIRRHVFPLLEAEGERLGAEYVRLRVGYKD